jgi:hypothetical protein
MLVSPQAVKNMRKDAKERDFLGMVLKGAEWGRRASSEALGGMREALHRIVGW